MRMAARWGAAWQTMASLSVRKARPRHCLRRYGVPLLVGLGIEAGRTSVVAASAQTVPNLVGRLRDHRVDFPPAQMTTDGAGGVGAVRQNGKGASPGSAGAGARHADAGHDGLEGRRVTGLACGEADSQEPCMAVRGQKDLRAQSAARASECMVGALTA